MKNSIILENALNTLCNVVKSTLGTNGRTVLFNTYDQENNKPLTTKDGVTIARNIRSENDYENALISIIREGALKTMMSSGDGTTTTTILIQYLTLKGMELLKDGMSIYKLKQAYQKALVDIVKYLRSISQNVESDLSVLEQVAAISANDSEIGTFIYNIIKEIGIYGTIDVKDSYLMATTVDKVKGMKLHKGYYERFMANIPKKELFYAKDAAVLIVVDHINSIDVFNTYLDLLEKSGRALVVFCSDISDITLKRIQGMVASGSNICFVEHDGFGERQSILMNDLALLTSAYCVYADHDPDIRNLGLVDTIQISQYTTSITVDSSDDKKKTKLIKKVVSEIQDKLDSNDLKNNTELSMNEKRFHQKRIANLTGGIAVINVGAPTQIEMRELKDRYDDAVLATYSAIKEGVLPGGGYAYLNCKHALEQELQANKGLLTNHQPEIAYRTVLNSLEAPFKQLLINSDMFNQFETFKEALLNEQGLDLREGYCIPIDQYNVYDATSVLIDSISNAISVSISLLSIKEMTYNGIRNEDK